MEEIHLEDTQKVRQKDTWIPLIKIDERTKWLQFAKLDEITPTNDNRTEGLFTHHYKHILLHTLIKSPFVYAHCN